MLSGVQFALEQLSERVSLLERDQSEGRCQRDDVEDALQAVDDFRIEVALKLREKCELLSGAESLSARLEALVAKVKNQQQQQHQQQRLDKVQQQLQQLQQQQQQQNAALDKMTATLELPVDDQARVLVEMPVTPDASKLDDPRSQLIIEVSESLYGGDVEDVEKEYSISVPVTPMPTVPSPTSDENVRAKEDVVIGVSPQQDEQSNNDHVQAEVPHVTELPIIVPDVTEVPITGQVQIKSKDDYVSSETTETTVPQLDPTVSHVDSTVPQVIDERTQEEVVMGVSPRQDEQLNNAHVHDEVPHVTELPIIVPEVTEVPIPDRVQIKSKDDFESSETTETTSAGEKEESSLPSSCLPSDREVSSTKKAAVGQRSFLTEAVSDEGSSSIPSDFRAPMMMKVAKAESEADLPIFKALLEEGDVEFNVTTEKAEGLWKEPEEDLGLLDLDWEKDWEIADEDDDGDGGDEHRDLADETADHASELDEAFQRLSPGISDDDASEPREANEARDAARIVTLQRDSPPVSDSSSHAQGTTYSWN